VLIIAPQKNVPAKAGLPLAIFNRLNGRNYYTTGLALSFLTFEKNS
jgi:hypothetical protein